MNSSLFDLIQEAIGYQALAFEADEDIDGGDLTEWFADWRARVKAAMRSTPALPRTTTQGRQVRTQLVGALQTLQALQRRRCTWPGDAESDRLIEALRNGGFQIVAGDLNITVFKRREQVSPCKR